MMKNKTCEVWMMVGVTHILTETRFQTGERKRVDQKKKSKINENVVIQLQNQQMVSIKTAFNIGELLHIQLIPTS